MKKDNIQTCHKCSCFVFTADAKKCVRCGAERETAVETTATTPQSEVMTLEAEAVLNSGWKGGNSPYIHEDDVIGAMEEYASQLKDKSDQLQTELEQVKAERDAMYKALKDIRALEFSSVIHPSIQGEKAIEIATKALQQTKQ